jgi:DNA-3-methyladenine glycosylase II
MAVKTFPRAAAELGRRDPVMAGLLDEFGPPKLGPVDGTHFEALVRSIVYQQLAGAAASAIHRRFVALVDGEVTAERVLALEPGTMRAAGLSNNKEASIRDLAAKTVEGVVVMDDSGLAKESDLEIVTRLSSVRGIGRWTAEMFLIFQLRRLDVWPTGDLGVRKGYGVAYDVATPTPKQLEELGEPFRPYRSVAAWYCWRAVERAKGTGPTAVTGAVAPPSRS